MRRAGDTSFRRRRAGPWARGSCAPGVPRCAGSPFAPSPPPCCLIADRLVAWLPAPEMRVSPAEGELPGEGAAVLSGRTELVGSLPAGPAAQPLCAEGNV